MPTTAAYLISAALLLGSPAASPAGETISGNLSHDGQPVAGVVITVRAQGQDVGTSESAADGSWEIPIPGPGIYEVEIDVASLPEGVALRNPDRSVLDNVEVQAGQHKAVVFPLGERDVTGSGILTRLLNLMAKGLVYGAIVAMASVGLSLIFGVTGLVDFAHGELVTFGVWITISTMVHDWPTAISKDIVDGRVSYEEGKGVRVVAEGIHFSNECKLDASEEHLYVVQTRAQHRALPYPPQRRPHRP